VRFRGTSLNGLKPHEVTSLGLVRTFQRTSVFQNNSVFENVLIGLHRRGRATVLDTLLALPRERQSERELKEEAWSILQLVGLERRALELAGALPYGTNVSSGSRSRSPPSLRCCSWTSRSRA
jgi:branched-chain amino acid transport system ATP-binding protein